MRVGLRRVLLAPTLAVALLAAAALAYVAWSSLVATRTLERSLAQVRRANSLTQRTTQLAGEMEHVVLGYRAHPAPALRDRLARREAEMNALARELGELDLSPRGHALWEQLTDARAVRDAQRRSALAAVDAGDADAIAREYARWELAVDRFLPAAADLAIFNLRRLERTAADVDRVRSRSIALLMTVLAASGLLVLGSSIVVERWLVRPLKAMTAAANHIASARVAIPVPGAERRDELGVLARATTQMAGDLVRANAELARSVVSRDEFLSIASHELKTPLTSLKLHLQMGERRWRSAAPEGAPAWLDAALRQLGRIESLISELLDLARIRSGRFELRRELVDVSKLVHALAERLRVVLARTGNALEMDVEPGVAGFHDAGRLEQLVTNLLANAAQHAPGAAVRVRVRRGDGAAILVVEDGGPGVPEDARHRVFAPYERGHSRSASSGLGLGLYIAKQIVDAHGGRIDLSPSALGGAAFTIVLPDAPAPVEEGAGIS